MSNDGSCVGRKERRHVIAVKDSNSNLLHLSEPNLLFTSSPPAYILFHFPVPHFGLSLDRGVGGLIGSNGLCSWLADAGRAHFVSKSCWLRGVFDVNLKEGICSSPNQPTHMVGCSRADAICDGRSRGVRFSLLTFYAGALFHRSAPPPLTTAHMCLTNTLGSEHIEQLSPEHLTFPFATISWQLEINYAHLSRAGNESSRHDNSASSPADDAFFAALDLMRRKYLRC